MEYPAVASNPWIRYGRFDDLLSTWCRRAWTGVIPRWPQL